MVVIASASTLITADSEGDQLKRAAIIFAFLRIAPFFHVEPGTLRPLVLRLGEVYFSHFARQCFKVSPCLVG